MSNTILAVDDDRKTVQLIRLYLERDGYQALTAGDGPTALALARAKQPDLIVLDVMLPRVDGLDICQTLRAESEVPIILLTARTTEADKLAGLEAGADDYVTKPFSPRELLARVRAVLRRARPADRTPAHITAGALHIDIPQHVVRLNGERVAVTPREFRLLRVLAQEPGRVFSRQELLERAFGPLYDGQERTVDVHLMNLRRKLEPDLAQPVYIQTVFGVGYRFGGPADVD